MNKITKLTLAACLAATSLLAQNVSYMNRGTVEAGVFGGFATGLGSTAAGAGGNIAVAASKNILPYFEVTFFPDLLNRTSTETLTSQGSGRQVSVTRKSSFVDYHGGIHLRLPIAKSRSNIMPYFVLGVGALHRNKGQVIIDGIDIGDPARSDLAVNFGGGLRWYVKQNFGIRIEAKGYKPNSDVAAYNDAFMKLTFGAFYIWGR